MRNEIAQLCEMAEARARAHGHLLGEWTAGGTDEARHLSAACARCGRRVDIRLAPGLRGVAGRALAEACVTASDEDLSAFTP